MRRTTRKERHIKVCEEKNKPPENDYAFVIGHHGLKNAGEVN